jgi:hypothetical protein
MRKFLISAALISAAAISVPAAAQYQDGRGYGYNNRGGQGVERQVQQLHERIDNMYQRRLLSDREVQSLHRDAENIRRRSYDYARNGLTRREHADLQDRIHRLRDRIQRERFEGREQRRDDRRDRW